MLNYLLKRLQLSILSYFERHPRIIINRCVFNFEFVKLVGYSKLKITDQ